MSESASKCLCLRVYVSAIMHAHDHRVRTQIFLSFQCEHIILVCTHAPPVSSQYEIVTPTRKLLFVFVSFTSFKTVFKFI